MSASHSGEPARAQAGERIVVALGGNAIAPAGSGGTAEEQTRNIRGAMRIVADLIASGREVVITHGNGPQVGNLLLKNEYAKDIVPPMPLDWCVAQTQATIGFQMCTALEHELDARGLPIPVIPIVSRILVDAADPAFEFPSKPIGRYLTNVEEVKRIQEETGQVWVEQQDRGWRRLVPSPEPVRLLDGLSMGLVLDAGAVLVANGGGGIPMVRDEKWGFVGVEAVVDKDLAGVLLAQQLEADRFLVLTDVSGVAVDHGTADERWLDEVTPSELRALSAEGHFAAGSMGPKVEAVLRFAEGGGQAAIGALRDAQAVIDGEAGTQVLAA